MTDRHNWDAYEKLVIGKLDDHTTALKAIHSEVIRLQVEMGIVKTKLSFIGFVSGMVGSILVMLIKQFMVRQGPL